MNMDFVDLDKVLDDFEEDEERVCMPGQELKPSGFAQYVKENSENYNFSVCQKVGDVPYPHQVSNDFSPLDSADKYNNGVVGMYDVPFELTEKIDLSEADFGPSLQKDNSLESSDSSCVSPAKAKLILREDFADRSDIINDNSDLGQFMTENGIFRVNVLQNNSDHRTILGQVGVVPINNCVDRVGNFSHLPSNLSENRFNSIHTVNGVADNSVVDNHIELEKTPKTVLNTSSNERTNINDEYLLYRQNVAGIKTHAIVMSSENSQTKPENSDSHDVRIPNLEAESESKTAPIASVLLQNGLPARDYTFANSSVTDRPVTFGQSAYRDNESPLNETNNFTHLCDNNSGNPGSDLSSQIESHQFSGATDHSNVEGAGPRENDYASNSENITVISEGKSLAVGFGEASDELSDSEVMEYLEGDGDVTQCVSTTPTTDTVLQEDRELLEPKRVDVDTAADLLLLHRNSADRTTEHACRNMGSRIRANLPEVACNTGTVGGHHMSESLSSSKTDHSSAMPSSLANQHGELGNSLDANSQDVALALPVNMSTPQVDEFFRDGPSLEGGVSSGGEHASVGGANVLDAFFGESGELSLINDECLGGGPRLSSGQPKVSVQMTDLSNPDVCPKQVVPDGYLDNSVANGCDDGNGGSRVGQNDSQQQVKRMGWDDPNCVSLCGGSDSNASNINNDPAYGAQVHDRTTISQSADGCPGVKPKDVAKLKRPTSLLGLSTVSLQMPFNIPKSQSLPRSFAVSDNSTVPCPSGTGRGDIRTTDADSGSASMDKVQSETKSMLVSNNADMAEEVCVQEAEGAVSVANDPTLDHAYTSSKHLPSDIAILDGDIMNVEIIGDGTCDSDAAVLRRDKELLDQAMQASLLHPVGDPQMGRPHSWGPQENLAPDATPKQKRPNSLNLPPRREFPPPSADRGSPSRDGSLDDVDSGGEASSTDIVDHPASHMQYIPEEGETSAGPLYLGEEGAVGGEGVHPYHGYPTGPQNSLGNTAPVWVPDAEAPNCMQCEARFTFTKRRHHCRACGKVFCSNCCSLKCKLGYMGYKEARVCRACHHIISIAQSRSGSADRSPNPNNPSEYCSTIPPHQQANAHTPAPTVMVPVGVLKREGSHRKGEPKQVMFSDGIRPGGDLTEAEGVTQARLPVRSGRKVQKVERFPAGAEGPQSASSRSRHLKLSDTSRYTCLIPAVGLPPVIMSTEIKGDFLVDDNPTDERVMQQIQSEDTEPVVFMINRNLYCLVKIVNLDCCVNRRCWCFTSRGMCTVGQDEMVVILECLPDENTIPMDIFLHYQTVYEEASKGNTVTDMGHSIFNQSFLGSKDHGGFLYMRPTFQCMQKLILPGPTYVFGILLQKWETPWAKVFPIRLLLRLGAEYRYYPCPLISIRNRKPVFFEIGHTIMNLLADFRSFQYMLPQVRGVVIHMEDKRTVINFPRNRYDDLMKVVNSSNEHVMALGANFSTEADSHLVCIQNDDGNYQTQAINIQNKPRKVTGASFVVFNGALKTTSGLTAKSSIVEDGLMVQISPESMAALKQAIKDMKNYNIGCGSVTATKPDEIVVLQWVDDDKSVNVGVKSPVDKMALDGIESVHIHNGTDYLGDSKIIRWTEVFFIQSEDSGSAKWEPIDLSRLAETLARAGCVALTPHLDKLKEASLTKLGLRATIDSESVGYEVGANGEKLPDFYMNDLDNELIPVIHNAASQNQEGPIILELIFHILD